MIGGFSIPRQWIRSINAPGSNWPVTTTRPSQP